MKPIILDCNTIIEDLYTDKETGKKCIIALNQLGYRVGYVEVNDKVPFRIFDSEKGYKYEYLDDESIVHFSNIMYNRRITPKIRYTLLVHGGVTFIGNRDYLESQMRAIGFDCAHYDDAPDISSVEKYLGKENVLYKMLSEFAPKHDDRYVWTTEDVRAELSDLAIQVKKAESLYLINLRKDKAKRWRNRKYNR